MYREKVIFLLYLIIINNNLVFSEMCFPLILDSIEKKTKNTIDRDISIRTTRRVTLYINSSKRIKIL